MLGLALVPLLMDLVVLATPPVHAVTLLRDSLRRVITKRAPFVGLQTGVTWFTAVTVVVIMRTCVLIAALSLMVMGGSHSCAECGGDGERESTSTYCTAHGNYYAGHYWCSTHNVDCGTSSSHSYCEHGNTSQHDS